MVKYPNAIPMLMIAIHFEKLSKPLRNLLADQNIATEEIDFGIKILEYEHKDEPVLLIFTTNSFKLCRSFIMKYVSTVSISYLLDLKFTTSLYTGSYEGMISSVKESLSLIDTGGSSLGFICNGPLDLELFEFFKEDLQEHSYDILPMSDVNLKQGKVFVLPSVKVEPDVFLPRNLVCAVTLIWVAMGMPWIVFLEPRPILFGMFMISLFCAICIQLILELNIQKYKLALWRNSKNLKGEYVVNENRARSTGICAILLAIAYAVIAILYCTY